jgi:hypothetical protein
MKIKFIIVFLLFILNIVVHATNNKNIAGNDLNSTEINKQLKNGFLVNSYRYKDYFLLNQQIYKTDGIVTQYTIQKAKKNLGKISTKNLATDPYNAKVYEVDDSLYFILEQESEYTMSYLILKVTDTYVEKIIEKSYSCQEYMPPKTKHMYDCYTANFTMYEKDGGLYLKVGSTYKSDVITLKKPTNRK